jgi:hypothetical protein
LTVPDWARIRSGLSGEDEWLGAAPFAIRNGCHRTTGRNGSVFGEHGGPVAIARIFVTSLDKQPVNTLRLCARVEQASFVPTPNFRADVPLQRKSEVPVGQTLLRGLAPLGLPIAAVP